MANLSKWGLFRLVWFSVVGLLVIWTVYSFQASGVASDICLSTTSLTVDIAADYAAFTPARSVSKRQLIFFPGALVDPAAYYPLLRSIAEKGYPVRLVKMPLRLAQYGYQDVRKMVDFSDTTTQFFLAGHSLGGKMAAQFAYENPGLITGLVLLGTSHPRDVDLSQSGLAVLKVYASNDGLASVDEVEQNKSKLPTNAVYILIDGGNHAQFGYYGSQFTDGTATISRGQQQAEIKRAVLRFLETAAQPK